MGERLDRWEVFSGIGKWSGINGGFVFCIFLFRTYSTVQRHSDTVLGSRQNGYRVIKKMPPYDDH